MLSVVISVLRVSIKSQASMEKSLSEVLFLHEADLGVIWQEAVDVGSEGRPTGVTLLTHQA